MRRLCFGAVDLDGHDVGKRWNEVADAWDNHADGKLYPFNDWHAAMAYLGAGRMKDVDRLIAQYRDSSARQYETAQWARADRPAADRRLQGLLARPLR